MHSLEKHQQEHSIIRDGAQTEEAFKHLKMMGWILKKIINKKRQYDTKNTPTSL